MSNPPKIPRRRFLDKSCKLAGAALLAPGLAAANAADAAGREKKSPWQIGIYTRPWAEYDYRAALDAIAEAGFKHAGLMTTNTKSRLIISAQSTLDEARAVGEEIKKRGLRVPSLWGGGIPVNESLEAGIKGLEKLVDNAAAAGVKNLLMGGAGKKDLYDLYYKAIAECCAYAEEKGVGLSLKPHGGLNSTGPQCRKTIESIGHKNFRIWYDPGNIFFYSEGKLDPADDASAVDGLVVGMAVKDFDMVEKNGKPAREVNLTPGTGRVDFPKVLARLKKGGFTGGPLVIECLAKGDEKQLLREAKKARRFVESLVA